MATSGLTTPRSLAPALMLFPDLPADARVWIFTADRPLRSAESSALLEAVNRFTAQWTSHGRPVPGRAALLDERFLAVAARLPGGVSGCGIDSLVHAVEEAGRSAGLAWLDGLQVVWRGRSGAVQAGPRAAFRKQVRAGAVTAETPVFLTTLDTLGGLRDGGLERPAGETWHARVFRLPALSA